ncbi:molybdopterin-guanine dinucleotide biosynthesis protein B [Bacillus pinisoli]|uniref:molybdopterin-guanine dinucleotide biosynthesis protein B n=1 Tax=Bacillus pinisoli TaxID=2901866 RepID=UPI001FF6F3C8|nr:molybdopterin-guanine dinucleotide biosynthesis protein B [Bacillus pinisoli]
MAMGLKLPILQVVGYQDSGKTTLMKKLVSSFTMKGYRVGTIKHHGHGGTPDFGDEGKDTAFHRQAGAAVVGVEGEGILQLTAGQINWSLENIISLYHSFSLDMILIEGYKAEHYPKVVLIRNQEDCLLLQKLSNILCVISEIPLAAEYRTNYQFFVRSEEDKYMTYIMREVRGDLDE